MLRMSLNKLAADVYAVVSASGDSRATEGGAVHCADCRKTSDSAFVMFAVWPRNAFQCTGEFSTYYAVLSVRAAVRV